MSGLSAAVSFTVDPSGDFGQSVFGRRREFLSAQILKGCSGTKNTSSLDQQKICVNPRLSPLSKTHFANTLLMTQSKLRKRLQPYS